MTIQLGHSRVGRIYVAGPMSGLPEHNFPAFNAKADELRNYGWTVLNPADHGVIDGAQWGDYLRHDIADLATCEAICMLPGWTKSKGARLEHSIAVALDMSVQFSVDAEPAQFDDAARWQGFVKACTSDDESFVDMLEEADPETPEEMNAVMDRWLAQQ